MVELAIAIPLFIAVLLAVIDFGLYFNNRIALQTAAYNYAKQADVGIGKCVTPPNNAIINESVAGVITNTVDISIAGSKVGTAPMQRYVVNLTYNTPANPLLSTLTQGIGLYPIAVNGVALCQ